MIDKHYLVYCCRQSHYIEVAHGVIFMEQDMRFWLILGRLAILKKKLGQSWAIFEGSFFMFSGAKEIEKEN
jgi:hypothetical protein